jgi:hypothetical protein
MVPFFVLSVVGGNTKRKDRVVVADTLPQEALSHNKTTWIVRTKRLFLLIIIRIILPIAFLQLVECHNGTPNGPVNRYVRNKLGRTGSKPILSNTLVI